MSKAPLSLHELVVGRLPGVIFVGALTYATTRGWGLGSLPALLLGLVAGVAFEVAGGCVVAWTQSIGGVGDILRLFR